MSRYVQICEDYQTIAADAMMKQREYKLANIKAELDETGQTSHKHGENQQCGCRCPARDSLVINYCNMEKV